MKKQFGTLVLCILCVLGCRPKDAVVPVGVSTFITRDDFKKQLGIDFIPQSLAFDRDGTLYVADYYRIVKITPDRHISLFAGGLPGYKNGSIPDVRFRGIKGMAFDRQGKLYIYYTHLMKIGRAS